MDLPDCPPGAEGYQDSVTEVPKKPDIDEETSCTKVRLNFFFFQFKVQFILLIIVLVVLFT